MTAYAWVSLFVMVSLVVLGFSVAEFLAPKYGAAP